jgi:hypothetical protein
VVSGARRYTLPLGALYVVAVGLLFASRVREFADETDNLLGGLLLARGQRLYVDYFSNHMPLAYYVAAVPAVFGASSLEQFRLFSNALLVVATLTIVWAFRGALSRVTIVIWAVLTVYAHTLQWGEMLTAGTLAGYGVLAAGLLFFTTPGLQLSPRQMLGLSAAVFIAVQSELLAVYPLLILAACFVAVRLVKARDVRMTAILLPIVVAPHLALLLALWLTGVLPDFVYDAYQFNSAYYSQFVMNSSVTGMLHDWEAQYRTYLLSTLRDPLGIQTALVLANFLATWVVFRTRGPLIAAVYYLFVALTHVRNEGAYYVCSYFSLALVLTYAIGVLRVPPLALRGAIALLTLNFVVQVAGGYDFSKRPIDRPEVGIVQALTLPGEKIFVAPYDPYIYLAAQRMPASRYPFYFPWQAIDPRSESAIISDLSTGRPPLVVFHRNELVNGQWRPGEYGAHLYDFLVGEGYAPLDSASSALGDVLVRPDRLVTARERVLTHP